MPAPPPTAALLLDFDGVVLDSEPLHEWALLDLYARRGWPVEDPRFMALKGRTEAVNFATITRRFGGDADAHRAVYRAAFDALVEGAALVPGVRTFVEAALARGLRAALVTSARRGTVDAAFARHGLAPLFETVVSDGDVRHAKPHPEPYLTGAARLGVDPAACLVVEDSAHGVASGVAAGCTVAGLTTTFPPDGLRAAGAHVVVDTLAELAAWAWPT